jgi:hypothetical protein
LKKESGTISLTLQRHQKLLFACIIHVGQCTLLGIDIVPMYENVNTALITYKQLHGCLGHPNDAVLCATARKFRFLYEGRPYPCENCACSKLRIKNIPKDAPDSIARAKGDRIMFDISSVKAHSQRGNKFRLLFMDEFTKYCWSFFLKNKSDLEETMLCWMHTVRKYNNIRVKCFQCDNAGESLAFQQSVILSYNEQITFDLRAHNTMVSLNGSLLTCIEKIVLC